MFIYRNAEGVHAYLLKCCRGTFSSVGMLKGYLARERLGTPVLNRPENMQNFSCIAWKTKVTFGWYRWHWHNVISISCSGKIPN